MKHVLLNSKLRPRAAVAALLGLALAALLLGGDGAVHAQDGLPPIADVRDLSLKTSYDTVGSVMVNFVLTNNSTIPMRDVRVRFTTDPPAAQRRMEGLLTGRSRLPNPDYDAASGIWTIPELLVASETAFRMHVPSDMPAPQYIKVRAEIIGSAPAEGAQQLDNNQAEAWLYVGRGTSSAYTSLPVVNTHLSVSLAGRTAGENPVFSVNAAAANLGSLSYVKYGQWDVVVKVALSEGLAFASNPRAPSGTTFSRTSSAAGVWRLGSGEMTPGTLRVPVRLTTDASAAPPLNRRCLTAQTVAGRPSPAHDPGTGEGGVRTACLGSIERVVVSGDVKATLMLRQQADMCLRYLAFCKETGSPESDSVLALHVGDSFSYLIYPPEEVVILVDAAPLDTPLTIGGTTYNWTSGHSVTGSFLGRLETYPGVKFVRGIGSNTRTTGRVFRISDVTPRERPGEIAEIWSWLDENTNTYGYWESLNPGKTHKLLDAIGDVWAESDWYRLVVFSEPGVYKVKMGMERTLKSDGKKYSATSTLTFVVGDVAELQVHDAGLHGTLPRGQQAYTLRAENNQDGTAEQVEVALSGVPEGARAVVSADGGRYSQGACDENGLCDGLWKIGELEGQSYRYNTGRSDGPTLTLLVEGRPDPITATIASAKTRTVTAGGKTYDIGVTDLVESNSKDVSVAAAAGRGERDPEQPMSLRVARLGSTALLRWEPVETVSRWPVAYYEVERDNRVLDVQVKAPLYLDLRESGGSSVYRVRAVNEFGAPGPWTERTSRGEAEKAQPPDPVTGLTAVPGDGFVDLEWRAIRSDEEIIWQIWRLDDPTWREVFPRAVGSSRLGYTVTELGNGVEYVFRVRAVTPSDDFGDLVGVASDLVSATPAAAQGQQSPEQGRTDEDKKQDDGPNHAPEFDRDAAWYPAEPWCASAGARSGTEVARVSAYDADGDSLAYYHVRGFDAIADEYFKVSTVKNGDAYEGVVRVSRTIPKDLEPHEGFINIDLEVNDGRGGLDQIGVSLKYAADGGTCE